MRDFRGKTKKRWNLWPAVISTKTHPVHWTGSWILPKNQLEKNQQKENRTNVHEKKRQSSCAKLEEKKTRSGKRCRSKCRNWTSFEKCWVCRYDLTKGLHTAMTWSIFHPLTTRFLCIYGISCTHFHYQHGATEKCLGEEFTCTSTIYDLEGPATGTSQEKICQIAIKPDIFQKTLEVGPIKIQQFYDLCQTLVTWAMISCVYDSCMNLHG